MTAQEQHENIINICKHEKIRKHLDMMIQWAETGNLYLPLHSERSEDDTAVHKCLVAIIDEANDAKRGIG